MALQSLTGRLATDDQADASLYLLSQILSRLGYLDQSQGAMRVTTMTGSIISTVTAVTTVTTVSTLSNITSVGGVLASNDQYVQGYLAYGQNRSRITVV